MLSPKANTSLREELNLIKIRSTRLEHPQDLNETTPHDHEHEENDETLTYGWIVDMLACFPNRNMSPFINVLVEFITSVAEASWCWLLWRRAAWGVINVVTEKELDKNG